MTASLVFLIFLLLACPRADSECSNEYYTYDGRCNNRANPDAGKANGFYRRSDPAEVPDLPIVSGSNLFSNRPNERVVSNKIIATHVPAPNNKRLNALSVMFGQFIVHDLTKTNRPADNRVNLKIEEADDFFLFFTNGTSKNMPQELRLIGVRRSAGEIVNNVFEPYNEVTGFLDGSVIYGSSAEENSILRTHENGTFYLPDLTVDVTSSFPNSPSPRIYKERNCLPTLDYTKIPIDISNIGADPKTVFSAGDTRASENLIITIIHTIFAREHNRIASLYNQLFPGLSDDEIFEKTRVIVTSLYQKIVYEEYLPTVWGKANTDNIVGEYRRYKPEVNAVCDNTLATAGFRVGHSTVVEDLTIVDDCGFPKRNFGDNGVVHLASQTPANPAPTTLLGVVGGSENMLRAAIYGYAEQGDNKIVNALRNIPINSQFATGIDVSAANLRRGRLHSVPNMNTLRKIYRGKSIYELPACAATRASETSLGPDPLACWTSWISDSSLAAAMRNVYQKVNRVDAYVGLLVEKLDSSEDVIGKTATTIVLKQFQRSRDGDRFYYENLPSHILGPFARAYIRTTSFSDLIKRNTDLRNVPSNAFKVPSSFSRECH